MTTSNHELPEAAADRTKQPVANYRDFVRVQRLLSALSMKGGSVDILETIQAPKGQRLRSNLRTAKRKPTHKSQQWNKVRFDK